MKNTPKFYNKNGDLTGYSFACGYVQRKKCKGYYKEIYMEHNHFHIKSGKIGEKWDIWETFDNLTEARKFYNNLRFAQKAKCIN